MTQFKSHSHIRACVSTRRRRAIFLWLNQLSCHANKIKSQRADDKCTKIIKCDSNERTRQAKPIGKEAAAAAGGTWWLSACQPACLKEPHFMTLSRSHRFFLCKELLPCMAPSRSLAPILHLCNSLLAVNNRNRLGHVAIKICLHRLSFAPCCTDRTGGEGRVMGQLDRRRHGLCSQLLLIIKYVSLCHASCLGK